MRKPLLFVGLSGLFVLASSSFVGCTSLLGDFSVSATGTEVPDGSMGTDSSTCATPNVCGAQTCVDFASDNANCGACGTACTGGQTCQASACKCTQEKAFCGNQCVVASRMACGSTCAACLNDEVCNQGCTAAPAPAFESVPRDPTGWKDSAGVPIVIKLKDTGIPGTLYECRTGPEAAFTPTDPPWKPCDGAAGTTPIHKPVKDATTPEGSYRTEYRYRSDTYRSPSTAFRFYAHSSLDSVGTCPAAGTPPITDAEFFLAAQQFAGFPSPDTFPAPGAVPADPIYLRNPFIKIPFVGVRTVPGMNTWPAPNAPFDHVVNERSLRHQFVMNPQRTMVLVKRQYVRPKQRDCKNPYMFGQQLAQRRGPVGRGPHAIDCEAFVLNVHGQALCIGRNAMNKPSVQAIDAHPYTQGNFGYNGSGTVTGTLGDTKLVATTATSGYMLNRWIFVHNGPPVAPPGAVDINGRWYKVVAVPNANTMTLGEPLQFAASGYAWKYSPNTVAELQSIITTGYAKLYDDGKNWATNPQAMGNFNPSFSTKCETAGCNTGKPWLTYLPP